jgi:hypothetical protein
MEDPGPHPEPPPDLAKREPLILMTAQSWYRTHSLGRPPLHFGRDARGRFDAPSGEYGTLYVAADEHAAFIETFGQSTGCNTVTLAALAARALTRIEPRRPLRLIDLAGSGGLARIGADARLCSGDRAVARRWSLALHRHPSAPDGILYPARHDPARSAAALFDHAASVLQVTESFAWTSPAHATHLGRILDDYRFALIEQ